MTRSFHRLRFAALVALAIPFTAGAALAQDRPGFLDNIFNRGDDQGQQQAAPQQAGGNDMAMRLDRIENSLRQLTGNIEQLQFRNQQLETQVRELQQRAGIAPQAAPGPQPGSLMPQRPAGQPTPQSMPQQAMPPNAAPGQRSDAFDPRQHPTAPGAPRVLGTETASAGPVNAAPSIGAPGGREAGAPLDLSNVSEPQPAAANGAPGQLPPPPASNPSATGSRLATLPPSAKPQDEYDMAYGYVLHKDYGLATQAFRDFIRKYPDEKLIPDAQYWMGEALYQQQHYRDAAEAFLAVSTKYERSGKAPDSLLRLGQSLAAMKKKEAACATLAEVGRKYPKASASVKRSVAAEQKRVHC
ncbi:MAG TPA: tol-pal system protein YbgF [Pseudolabrys sp.]|nr:tol-pal system protein YbgF [Pseudolabrys sp.]